MKKQKDSLFIGKDTTPIFIKEVSKKLNIPHEKVEAVMQFIGRRTHQAFKENNSIELSGFGTLIISKPRLKKKLTNITKQVQILEEEIRMENSEKLLISKQTKLDTLKTMLVLLNEKNKETNEA